MENKNVIQKKQGGIAYDKFAAEEISVDSYQRRNSE